MSRKSLYLLFIPLFVVFSCTEKKEEPVVEQEEEIIEKEPDPVFMYGMNANEFIVDSGMVEPNQGLTHILPQYGISQPTIYKIAEEFDSIFDVRKIKPNHPYYVFCTKDSAQTTKCFIYEKNAIEYVVFNFEDSLNVFVGEKEVDVEEKQAG